LKRPELADKSLPATLDPRDIEIAMLKGESERQYEENVSLIARIAQLETEVDNLNRREEQIRRDRDHWYYLATMQRAAQNPDYSTGFQDNRGLAQQMQAQSQLQSAQALAQAAQNQVNAWHRHDCTCVPGRASTFGILRRGDS
jgi:hypothetical protein